MIIFLSGCTNSEITDKDVNNKFSSSIIDSFVSEYDQNNKRPYFEEDMYYTLHEEITFLSHEFIMDKDGNPTLVVWLNYKNTGDSDKTPIGIRSYFHFYQNEQEMEDFAYLSKGFSDENPQYGEAYQHAINVVSPGDEVEIYLAIPLEDKSDVRLELEQKNQSEDNKSIIFNSNKS